MFSVLFVRLELCINCCMKICNYTHLCSYIIYHVVVVLKFTLANKTEHDMEYCSMSYVQAAISDIPCIQLTTSNACGNCTLIQHTCSPY